MVFFANKDIEIGEELLNNYGEHTKTLYFIQYGYIEETAESTLLL